MTLASLFRLVTKYGFTLVFATVALWVLLFRSPAATAQALKDMRAQVVILDAKVDAHGAAMAVNIADQHDYNTKMLRLAYLQCLNGAHGQGARDACEAALK